METRGDTQAYDAFGEPLPALRRNLAKTVGPRARMASVAVFWTLALLLVAGRVHYAPSAPLATMELAAR